MLAAVAHFTSNRATVIFS